MIGAPQGERCCSVPALRARRLVGRSSDRGSDAPLTVAGPEELNWNRLSGCHRSVPLAGRNETSRRFWSVEETRGHFLYVKRLFGVNATAGRHTAAVRRLTSHGNVALKFLTVNDADDTDTPDGNCLAGTQGT
jgi:hypothetical protein